MSGALAARLEAGAAVLGRPLAPAETERLLALVALLEEGNQRLNLTAIREPAAVIDKHLLDSLTVQPYLRGPEVIDVGTGAGFPGLPLAILNPGLQFTLLDSIGKKVRFVEQAILSLGLANATAVCSRAENYRPRTPAQTVLSRALAEVAVFVRQAGHLCADGGRLLAMKGRDPAAELAALPAGWRLVGVERLAVPGLPDARHLVILERRP